jgi:hypothetical protein
VLRIPQLEAQFESLLRKEQNWPTPLASGEDLYADFCHTAHSLTHNIICASCSIIGHDSARFQSAHVTDRSLRFLSIPEDIYVPYDFSSGVNSLEIQHIMIDKQGLSADDEVSLCNSCYKTVKSGRHPHESFANFRWVGP